MRVKKKPLTRPLLTQTSSGTDEPAVAVRGETEMGPGGGGTGTGKTWTCRPCPVAYFLAARVIIKLKPRALYMYKTEAVHFSDWCTFESSL